MWEPPCPKNWRTFSSKNAIHNHVLNNTCCFSDQTGCFSNLAGHNVKHPACFHWKMCHRSLDHAVSCFYLIPYVHDQLFFQCVFKHILLIHETDSLLKTNNYNVLNSHTNFATNCVHCEIRKDGQKISSTDLCTITRKLYKRTQFIIDFIGLIHKINYRNVHVRLKKCYHLGYVFCFSIIKKMC